MLEQFRYGLVLCLMFSFLLICPGGVLAEENSSGWGEIVNIDVMTAQKIISDNSDNNGIVMLDVRTGFEFNRGHIEGAKNINYLFPGFKKKPDKLNREKTYIVYCRSGHRSGNSAKVMKKMGFSDVKNMLGGILAWKKAGYSLAR